MQDFDGNIFKKIIFLFLIFLEGKETVQRIPAPLLCRIFSLSFYSLKPAF